MVLVTGAAGHLGCALVRELVADGEEVRVLVLPQEDLEGLRGIPLHIVKGNVLDLDSIRRAASNVDVVYHLAGIVSIMPGKDELMHRVNVEGTANVAGRPAKAASGASSPSAPSTRLPGRRKGLPSMRASRSIPTTPRANMTAQRRKRRLRSLRKSSGAWMP